MHKWRPIKFCLIVDDFGLEYVGERHTHHLRHVLKQRYYITEDWAGTKFAGIYIEWNYDTEHIERTCCLCIKGYIKDLLLRFGNNPPYKPHLSPQKHCDIIYGAKVQMTHEVDTSPPLDEAVIKCI